MHLVLDTCIDVLTKLGDDRRVSWDCRKGWADTPPAGCFVAQSHHRRQRPATRICGAKAKQAGCFAPPMFRDRMQAFPIPSLFLEKATRGQSNIRRSSGNDVNWGWEMKPLRPNRA
jgi:hypothetical protein